MTAQWNIKIKGTRWMLLMLLGAFLAFQPVYAEEPVYVENQWNFVDGSMDVSGGIPQEALGRLGRIRDSGKLTVATEPYYPPQEFIDPAKKGQDSYVGADMELARLIAQRMGVELEIVPMAFSEVLESVAAGKYDLAISALAFTEGRAAVLEMSKGYYYSGEETACGLLVRQEAEISAMEDLTDRDIAAQSGSLQEMLCVSSFQEYRQFRRLSSVSEVIEAVRSGMVDAGILDSETALQYVAAHPDEGLRFVPVGAFTLREEYKGDRVAGPKGEIQLLYFVNGVIDEVLASDQYTRWLEEAASVLDGR